MNSSDTHTKVAFKLERDEDGYPPVDWEDLWAVRLGDNRYRIDNVPFYTAGIGSGDIVLAALKNEKLVFEKLLESQGHSTIRVIVYDADLVQRVRNELSELGCSTELSNLPTFFSVDVPPSTDYSPVAELLGGYADGGILDYEESALRHS